MSSPDLLPLFQLESIWHFLEFSHLTPRENGFNIKIDDIKPISTWIRHLFVAECFNVARISPRNKKEKEIKLNTTIVLPISSTVPGNSFPANPIGLYSLPGRLNFLGFQMV